MSADPQELELTVGLDLSAAVWAGIVAGCVSLLLYVFFVPAAVGAGNAWAVVRFLGSILLGPDVLAPPATFDAAALASALVAHFALSLLMALVIAFVLHRWGLVTGTVGGAVFGLGFFAINYYTLTWFWPHFFAMAHWSVALVHMAFGALAGGLYEWLETEPYERHATIATRKG